MIRVSVQKHMIIKIDVVNCVDNVYRYVHTCKTRFQFQWTVIFGTLPLSCDFKVFFFFALWNQSTSHLLFPTCNFFYYLKLFADSDHKTKKKIGMDHHYLICSLFFWLPFKWSVLWFSVLSFFVDSCYILANCPLCSIVKFSYKFLCTFFVG